MTRHKLPFRLSFFCDRISPAQSEDLLFLSIIAAKKTVPLHDSTSWIEVNLAK